MNERINVNRIGIGNNERDIEIFDEYGQQINVNLETFIGLAYWIATNYCEDCIKEELTMHEAIEEFINQKASEMEYNN